MEFAVPQVSFRTLRAPSTRRCTVCHEAALLLERRHVSPERWGKPVVTEFYECDCCDTRYAYSPADERWRRLTT
jgi:hypothetical protein